MSINWFEIYYSEKRSDAEACAESLNNTLAVALEEGNEFFEQYPSIRFYIEEDQQEIGPNWHIWVYSIRATYNDEDLMAINLTKSQEELETWGSRIFREMFQVIRLQVRGSLDE